VNLSYKMHRTVVSLSAALILALIFSITTLAVRHERLIDTWQPSHYDVSLTLNQRLSELTSAQATIDVVAVKSLSVVDFDFGELTTDAVKVNGSPVHFDHHNGKLDVTLPTTVAPSTRLQISITYHGKPKDGLILTADKDGTAAAIGDNWPDRVHNWIPSLDHPSAKATVTFHISAPIGNAVIANGQLTKIEKNDSGTKIWTYTEGVPIPPYCMIIGVGEFAQLEQQSMVPPLSFYVPYSDREYAAKGFSSADEALQMFSRLVAPYPYEKLALIVGATRFGGMENSSAIVFPSTLFIPKLDAKISKAFSISTGVEDVVSHEIAHQWFGDSVTESTWADLWLSEGFATYFAGLFIQKYEGEDAFQLYMQKASETALAYEKTNLAPIHDRDTEDLFKLLNGNNYQKGAWVLHMLRSRLGDGAFFRGLRSYYKDHKNATASTEDLRAAFEKSSGQKLQSFFQRWVYESGHPQYEESWTWLPNEQQVEIALIQHQKGEAFLDPVPIVITAAQGSMNAVINPTDKSYRQTINSKQPPLKVEVDPGNTLLKEVIRK